MSSSYRDDCALYLTYVAVEFVGRAKAIAYCGSVFGKFDRPTNFVCLLLRMLQIGIDRDTAMEYLYCKSFVYLRLLGAFYIRLVEEPVFVYQALEKLYCDFQDVVYRTETGAFEKTSIDEVVDLLLTKQRVHGVALPRLQPRAFLEKRGLLQPYVSPLDVDDYEDPVIDAEAGGRADSKSVDADGGA